MNTSTSAYGTEKVSKLLRRYAVPAILSMIVNSLYNIVDQIFIGQGVGYLGNAATNVVFPFVTLSLAVSLMIGDGASALYSLKLGEGDTKTARAAVGNSLLLSSISGIVLMVGGLIFLQPILQLFGSTEAVLPYATSYGRICLLGMPFVCAGTGISSIIRADESPGHTMVALMAGAIINTILDPIFIFVLGWSVEGAAIATVIGQAATFFINIAYVKKFKHIDFDKSILKFDFKTSKKILTLGFTGFVSQFAMTIVLIMTNNALSTFGAQSVYGSEIPLAALGIVMKVNQILLAVIIGLGVGAQPIIGYNYGAKKLTRVKKVFHQIIVLSTVVAVAGFLVFQLAPQFLVSIFGSGDELYMEFATKCFRIYLAACFFVGFNDVASLYFQAVGKVKHSLILTLCRKVVFLIPPLLILPHIFGVSGVLSIGPIPDILGFILTFFMVKREWKKLSVQEKEEALELEENKIAA